MPDFNTIDEYETYIRDLSLAELRNIKRKIDKNRYPDRYNLVCNMIRNKEVLLNNNALIIKTYYPMGVKTILYVDKILLAFIFIALFLILINNTLNNSTLLIYSKKDIESLIGIIVIIIEIYGINKHKSWVVDLVLIFSCLGIISILFHRPENFTEFFAAIIGLTLFGFRVYVFGKNETRLFFNSKGDTLY